ncbi:3-oxoacyl-[acyl-carrier-protein] synthase-1 [Chitinophaga ginsengisegetis]|uniref:3-oxoacyl-[acyl-carrier-protein] synthase 1 n=1 Tax=Chitinophaga ginsengisegetis TaxID=393003 RepID=A0A1T5P110_9BACT|nr:beta-ketoacyl-[acyl-carrier-protein] synthase family protein [Chitinophaga ginsengisegetis]MDR6566999.1 3-oxoacyl-[acyl-carrier-protein] synthase-1 [Chitinophaga ginsengisegetis]MDR6646729.1 3-oxoacyl-[acyl-carrier-protein] synthase-1 [Chitinophaga ginsengisegetis]MDR6653079.1 3-oxoacyl-[acyl-carrier-protein] synthase-1 [Chitinophaga ginsengisegetis]SKD05989.1 3-oxoacyl-[acyl-carrier-protein] synthase-1 [Chitinophaga ginsengisegetis]
MNRVVITGMGIYSCIGKDMQEVKDSLYQGKSGIVLDPERKTFGYRSGLTGYIERPELKGLLDRRARLMMPEQAEFAYMATREALAQAGMTPEYIDSTPIGLLYGNDSSAKPVVEANDVMRAKKDTMLVGSGSVFQTMNSTVNMNLATIFKLRGVNFTVSAACASGSHAIGLGYMFIRNGMQDAVICGGAQEVNVYAMGNFDAIAAFSVREGDPTRASRPFDRDRDGLVPSGGAATVILESLESAQRRGATILGEVLGYGFSSNGAHISNPTVDGPVRSLQIALQDAGLQPGDIEYINAHATSTAAGDASEAKAIHEVFGASRPYVSSTKSMTGHECWMAGASEIVYSMLMMQHGFIAPNINLDNPDEDAARLNIVTSTINKNFNIFLSNSFGFGGTNSSLIVRGWNGK